jgi:hypothetical protein
LGWKHRGASETVTCLDKDEADARDEGPGEVLEGEGARVEDLVDEGHVHHEQHDHHLRHRPVDDLAAWRHVRQQEDVNKSLRLTCHME